LGSAAIIARGVDMQLALRLGEEAMEIADDLGDDRLLIEAGQVLCCILYFAGMPDRGIVYGEAAAERARRLGDDGLLGPSLVFLLMCIDQVQPDRTEALAAEAIACVERSGDQSLAGGLYNNAGVSSLRKGDLPSARRFLQRAEAAFRAVGLNNPTPMINLGWVLRLEGDEAGAADAFLRALLESRRAGKRPDIPYATLGLACHASDTGDWRRAAVLHGFADAFLESSGEPWQDPEDVFRQQSLDKVRGHLGDTDFEVEYGRGTSLDLRSVIDLALRS
jgi:tetratricopeptide (TPR) repeat protein